MVAIFLKKHIKGIDIFIYIIYNTYINKKQEVTNETNIFLHQCKNAEQRKRKS